MEIKRSFVIIFLCTPIMSALMSSVVYSSICITSNVPVIYGYSLLYEDFNNDGITDKYEIDDEYSYVSLSQNGVEFSDTYQLHETWALNNGTLESNSGIPTYLISFDADNDGNMDVAAAFGSRIVIRKNINGGDFSQQQQFISLSNLYGIEETQISESLAQYGAKLLTLDINNDGYNDFILTTTEGISVFLNDTSGLFYHQTNQVLPNFSTKDIDGLYAADLDADANSEVVISSRGSYVLYIDSVLGLSVVSIPNQSNKIEPVDFDGDGDLDFLEASTSDLCQVASVPDFSRYWLNDGDGVFSEKVVSTNGTNYIDPFTGVLPAPEPQPNEPVTVAIPGPEPQQDEPIAAPISETELQQDQPKTTTGGGGSLDFLFIALMLALWSLTGLRRVSYSISS